MQFEHAHALLLLLAVPGLYAVYRRYNTGRKESVLEFSSLGTVREALAGRSFARTHLPFILMMAAVGAAAVALADPQVPVMVTKMEELKGRNISIVLDGSESMAATDYEPTRLDAAKRAIIAVINGLDARDYVGVVLFETGATTVSYLTHDKGRAAEAVASIRHGQGATALGDGLSLGVDMTLSIPDRERVVILLSDGVHNSGLVTPEEAAAYANVTGVRVHTIGIGSEEPTYLRDDVFGEPQYAELDGEELMLIAHRTGGTFSESLDGQALYDALASIEAGLEHRTEYASVGEWFAAAVIGLLLASAYVIYGRYRIVA